MPNFTNLGLLFLLSFLISTVSSQAQFSETIQSGRPGQSIVANTVGKGIFQFQQGGIFSQSKSPGLTIEDGMLYRPGDRFTYKDVFTTENVIRYGVTERFEVNASVNYDWEKHHADENIIVFGINGGYLSTFDIGGRVNISQQENVLPTMAVQARLGMGQNYHESDFELNDIEITAAFAWQLGANHGLTVNLVPIFSINGFDDRYNYTVAYTWSFAQDWTLFIENYGGYTASDQIDSFFSTYFDGGFAWVLNDNVQLDILGGYGKNEIYFNEVQSFFVSAGVSWRIQTIN